MSKVTNLPENTMTQTKTGPDIAPGRLSEDQYSANFDDLHPRLDSHEAVVEADRCYFCYDAPCVTACPTGIDIPQFIRQISTGNPTGSAKTIYDQNILGGMCARVCPTETLCEQACVRNDAEGKPVKIGPLQRFATDHYMETHDKTPYVRGPDTGRKVAIVGAGPAGLACAHSLAVEGHAVTVFEAREKAGGHNEYGIASYKTVDDFAAREVEFISSVGGIEIKTGMKLGTSLSLVELQRDYDAVFLSIGLLGVNALGIENEEHDGVIDAIDYIADLRQADDLSQLPVGGDVVVIGGGMTAIDIAVQKKLLGAENVTIAYRRGKEHMNASVKEQTLAQTNGVMIMHWAQPHEIVGDDGHVERISFERTKLDEDGNLVGTGEFVHLDADMVFKAVGQTLRKDEKDHASDHLTIEGGRIVVDAQRKTSLDKVWAGGDCIVGGDNLTVSAVEDGKVAAAAIHQSLSG